MVTEDVAMSKVRLIALVGGTLVCALSIGYVMQRTQPAPAPVQATKPVPATTPNRPPADPVGPVTASSPVRRADATQLDLSDIALTSAPVDPTDALPDQPVKMPQPAAIEETETAKAADPMALPETPAEPQTPQLSCDVTATATPTAGALVDLSVSAPCQPNARVVVHHHGMIFSAVTDDQGLFETLVPALAERAIFIAAFDDGTGSVATARLTDIADFDRIVLQWSGPGGFQMHAREFGAAYGEPGHVWSGAEPQADADRSVTGQVLRLGGTDTLAPLTAEVYSFPVAAADRSGTIELSVEAEVTAQNCGRDISAQLLERQGSDSLRTRELEVSVPACDAVGDFLVLNNLLDDLKIAAK